MAEPKLDKGAYDDEELGNIARIIQVSGLSKEIKGGYFLKVGPGTSMNPTIRTGDTILWAEVDNASELGEGDIILFKSPVSCNNLAHRIVGIIEAKGEYFFLTKGDNLPNRDRFMIPEGTVLGVVVGVIYKIRWESVKVAASRRAGELAQTKKEG